jgi:FKBP-type peptidyl-prolyl cis-trans isomerase
MKFNFGKLGLFAATGAMVLTACKHSGSGSSGSYDTDAATGVMYRFIKHDDKGKKPGIGDYATMEMQYKTDKDSVLFNSITAKRRPGDTTHTITIPLRKSFSGCLEQGITLMAIGDSAEFKVSADSLFLKTFGARQLPPFAKPGSSIIFNIKLTAIQSQQEVQQQQQEQRQKMMEQMQQLKVQEPAAIGKYLADNKINAKPTKDSLFFLERTPGKGKAIKDGDSVAVSYEGSLLDGTVFDKSTAHGGPYHIKYGPDAHVIKGWIEALSTMHEGEKARVLIPSALGYGPMGNRPTIPPYAPLIFNMEVVKVWGGK